MRSGHSPARHRSALCPGVADPWQRCVSSRGWSRSRTPAPTCPPRARASRCASCSTSPPTRWTLLLERGWRRFGPIYFRPACASCTECVSLRVLADRFEPSKSQRRAARACSRLRRVVGPPRVDDERLALYARWHAGRESARGWQPNGQTPERYSLEFAFPHPCAREAAFYDDERRRAARRRGPLRRHAARAVGRVLLPRSRVRAAVAGHREHPRPHRRRARVGAAPRVPRLPRRGVRFAALQGGVPRRTSCSANGPSRLTTRRRGAEWTGAAARRGTHAMSEVVRVLGISGSLRKGSFNTALLRAAIAQSPREHADRGREHRRHPALQRGRARAGLPGAGREAPRTDRRVPTRCSSSRPSTTTRSPASSRTPSTGRRARRTSPSPERPWPSWARAASIGGTMRAQYHLRQIAVYLDMHPLNKPEIFVKSAAERLRRRRASSPTRPRRSSSPSSSRPSPGGPASSSA